MSLSFRIISISGFMPPACCIASKAIPAVIAPSPITATVFFSPSFNLLAIAIPTAELIDVLECPAPKASKLLSLLDGKGARPSFDLIELI